MDKPRQAAFKPDRAAYFLTALVAVAGAAYLVATPPYQVADEPQHFLRAVQVSQGQIFATAHGTQLGGVLPVAVIQDSTRFTHMAFHAEIKTSLAEIREKLGTSRRLSDQDAARPEFVAFANTAIYSPVPYVPQAVAVSLSRALDLPVTAWLYAARCANLLAFVLLCFFAIALAGGSGRGRLALFALAVMPMTAFQAGAAGADSVVLGLSFLSVAIAVAARLRWSNRLGTAALAVAALLSTAKSVYVLVPLVLVPAILLSDLGRRTKIGWTAGLAGACLVPGALWSIVTKATFRPHRTDAVIDPSGQAAHFLMHPLEFGTAVARTSMHYLTQYTESFVGTLGWLDTRLPGVFIGLYLGLLVAVLFIGRKADTDRPSPRLERVWYFVLWSATILLIFASLAMVWNPVGVAVIEGIQGRYFIPLVPLLLLCAGAALKLEARIWAWWHGVAIGLACAGSLFGLVVAVRRYWGLGLPDFGAMPSQAVLVFGPAAVLLLGLMVALFFGPRAGGRPTLGA